MSGEILTGRDGPIATVTISAPARMNALNLAMWRQMTAVFHDLASDDDLRCIVLRGAGDKAFAAGADIAEFESERSNVAQARTYGATIAAALDAVAACPHPVVACIQGACIGGGTELVCMTDIRIANRSARFGIPVNRLGLVVAYDEMRGLVDLVGKAVALEICLEGRIFNAEEAFTKGLVTRLADDTNIVEEAYATARRIASGAPLVARWHKRFINRLLDPAPLTEKENDESFACFGTADFQTGFKAFVAKEKPTFEGR